MPDFLPVRRALLSVSDKRGLVEFAAALRGHGVELLSTGGTARALREAGLDARDISEHTGFPEMMDGRLKTLHPKVHGGLLGRRRQDAGEMARHGIEAIDLAVVNLYPFEATVARADCDLASAIENIDIGGPAMLRSAAKNCDATAPVCDPDDYAGLIEELAAHAGGLSLATRRRLALKAFQHTARYDGAIASWLGQRADFVDAGSKEAAGDGEAAGGKSDKASPFPQRLRLDFDKIGDLRYGENPHQAAAWYAEAGADAPWRQLAGKELSYNNLVDADAARECALAFERPACAIVKHANPCGVAVADSAQAAYDLAYATDPVSAFGGVIAFNRKLDAGAARRVLEMQFAEIILAPEIDDEAVAACAAKPNLRLIACGASSDSEQAPRWRLKRLAGSLLAQERDAPPAEPALRVVSRRQPSPEEIQDMLFAWRVARFVKSNAIVYAAGGRTLGVGAGQMSRIDSARIAAMKAAEHGHSLGGAAMASDAFFPFRDGIDAAREHGVAAVIEPGGSRRDDEVIAAADEHGMALAFTGMRHFNH